MLKKDIKTEADRQEYNKEIAEMLERDRRYEADLEAADERAEYENDDMPENGRADSHD